jgi:ATP-dependent DNA helicase DinG
LPPSAKPTDESLTIDRVLGPGGLLSKQLSGYEARPQQLEMARAVAAALAQREHLIVEAGTGVGKSLAYLAPAILATARAATASNSSAETEEPCGRPGEESDGGPRRVVVSTHTISLQEQLITKDLPLLQKALPIQFSAVLAKGRGNYLSLRRLDNALRRSGNLFSLSNQQELRDLRAWSKETEDGSLADLHRRPPSEVWSEVASDSGNCMGRRCPTFSKCFYYKAREAIKQAQIVVVNHALFFADLALRELDVALLPDYDAVVFDEAHTVEEAASQHLGLRVTSGQVEYTLARLMSKDGTRGLTVGKGWKDVEQTIDACRRNADRLFALLEFDGFPNDRDTTTAVKEPTFEDPGLATELTKLGAQIRKRAKEIDQESQRQDFLSLANRAGSLAGELTHWIKQRDSDFVYWLERDYNRNRRSGTRVELVAAPLNIGATLNKLLYEKVPSVIYTSATLAVGRKNDFRYFTERSGLTIGKQVRLGSPFDYPRQAKIILAKNMPDPTTRGSEFERKVVAACRKYVTLREGRAFALFTSYGMLRNVAEELRPWLTAHDYALYSQADGMPRARMVEQFKQNPRGILLGTELLAGRRCRQPANRHHHQAAVQNPLLVARLEALKEAGGNPFMLPKPPSASDKALAA